jgi:hypothetical protein
VTEYMPRSAWTSTPRGGAQLTGSQLVGIACHWPGTTTDAYGVESESTVASRLRGWRDFHVNTRGWADIGYNFAVDQAGRVWDLRGLIRVGAHCASPSNPDANHEWLGVLFILGDEERPNAAMIRAFQDFRFDVFLPRWPGRTRLTGHGRAPGVPGAQTSCPGPFVAAKITDGTLAQQPTGDDDMPTPEEYAAAVWRAQHTDPITGTNARMVDIVERIRKDANAANPEATSSAVWRAQHTDPITGTNARMVDIVERIRKDAHAANPEATASAVWGHPSGLTDANGEPIPLFMVLRDLPAQIAAVASAVGVDAQELAAALAPLLIPHLPEVVVDLDDEALAEIATAVADEQARRLTA